METKPALVARSLPGVLWLVLNPEEKFSGQIGHSIQEADEALRNPLGLAPRLFFPANFCLGALFPKHPSTLKAIVQGDYGFGSFWG